MNIEVHKGPGDRIWVIVHVISGAAGSPANNVTGGERQWGLVQFS